MPEFRPPSDVNDRLIELDLSFRYPTTGAYTICMRFPHYLLPASRFLRFFFDIGDFFIPSFQCPHRVERVGVLGDGGKWVCGVERLATQEKCVVYSFGAFFLLSRSTKWPTVETRYTGINGESSFEASLLERAPGCEVWGYDFTVNSVRIASPKVIC